MTDDGLRERVARKIAAFKMLLSNDGENLPHDLWTQCLPEADNIIAAARPVIRAEALEEAAKVADEHVRDLADSEDIATNESNKTAVNIATAIRALKEKSST